jgi:protein arginine kinase activator
MELCPLTNKPCQNPKNIHINETVNGEIRQLEMCDVCGIGYACKNKSVISPPSLNALIQMIDGIVENRKKIVEKYKCPGCDFTFDDVIKKSRFGCPQCYETFYLSAKEIFERCQDGLVHVGKRPTYEEETKIISNIFDQILSLQEKIKKAIAVENYEIAAMLKKKIDELKLKVQK